MGKETEGRGSRRGKRRTLAMGRVWSPLLHREKGGAGVASQIIWSLANVGREMA